MHQVLLSAFLILSLIGSAQNITGTINTYYQVNTVNTTLSTMTVLNATGLSPNDSVIIISMTGAFADETSTDPAVNGSVVNYNGAGSYELGEICEVNGNTVGFKKAFANNYVGNGKIQLVRFNTYNNAVITGVITCQSWNSATGGVVVIYDRGNLTFQNDIDVAESGFRGGQHNESGYSCNFLTSHTEFGYNVTTGLGAAKGEGIVTTADNAGRGPAGNGGGGGNDHNSGGGGGSNAGSGGIGGENDDPGTFNCKGYYPGLGGHALNTTNRLFLGGGGGAGHSNSTWITSGANGGGIVIIIADNITGNGHTIRANGGDAAQAHGDGAGGGGAGGSVFVYSNAYSGSLTIDVGGGNGGDMDASAAANTDRCFGPGGGGAGGLIRFGPTGIPGGVTTILNPGSPGIVVNSTAGCNGSSVNAEAGTTGLMESDGVLPEGVKCAKGCPSVTQVDLGPDQQICSGESVLLDAGNPGLTYAWNTGETSQTISASVSGEYSVLIDDGYCIACDTVYVDASASLSVAQDTVFDLCDGPVNLDAGNPSASHNWSTGDTTQVIITAVSGDYQVYSNNAFCDITLTFHVYDCLNVPNTITPNGDGYNDSWVIDGLGDYPDHNIRVFNRRNQRIFESVDYQGNFDASGYPSGVYYYEINLGKGLETLRGTLTVLR